jgi:hypothetical protein
MAPQGVCVAFNDSTLEPNPSWTRLDDPSGYNVVGGWTVDRGRSKEMDKNQTGTATIDIVDQGGILDPTNVSSPFVDNIDPMKQGAVALQNPVTNVWSTIYRGFSDWTYEISSDTGYKVLKGSIEMDDAFDLMSALEMTPGNRFGKKTTNPIGPTQLLRQFSGDIQYAEGQQMYERINQALLNAGWPSSMKEIFTGNIFMQVTTYARRDQLITVILDAADAEFPGVANVYVAKDGKVTAHGRYARFDPFNPQYGINQWYAGDYAACQSSSQYAPINKIVFRRSKQDIINVALALPKGVLDHEAPGNIIIDEESVGKYGWRSVQFEDLLTFEGIVPGDNLTAVQETKLYGQYFVDNYAAPKTRITQLVFRPKWTEDFNAAALWGLMCDVEIGDVVTVKTTHPGGGGFGNEDFFVEGIHYSAKPMKANMHDITLTLDVSPRAFYVLSPFYS